MPEIEMDHAAPDLALRHDKRLLALTGCICFPASFILFSTVAAPSFADAGACAALATLLAMALVGAFPTRRIAVHNQRMRVALNNMSQGLCMFDRNERLEIGRA